MKVALGVAALALAAGHAFGGLITTHVSAGTGSVNVNQNLGANEYGPGNAYNYSGGGGGFGGPLGSGKIYMESNGSNLFVGFQHTANLNDNVVLYLDTKPGGFTSSTQMDDNSDPGRGRSSDPMSGSGAVLNLPIGADYSIVIGTFGIVAFELKGNGTAHNFLSYSGAYTGNTPGFREFSIPLSGLNSLGGALGAQNYIDFVAVLTSDNGFMSNESIAANAFNGGNNPGFDNNGNALTLQDYHRFQVPTPGALALLGLGGLVAGRRRR